MKIKGQNAARKGGFLLHKIVLFAIIVWKAYIYAEKEGNMQLKIEYIDKNKLKPYANNAKIHTPDQIKQIKTSIEKFGFNDPIAVWHDNEIVEGHGRLMAAMEMDNLTELPIIRLDDLTDEQRRAYMLAHNKLTTNTGFDMDLLNMEIDNILDIDMSDFGFDSIDALELDDVTPEPEKSEGEKEKNVVQCHCPKCGFYFEVKK